MNRFGRLVAIVAVGLLAAVGVTGVLAGPGGVFDGASDAPPAEVVAPDQPVAQSGDSSDDGAELEVKGDVIDCAAGDDTRFKFEANGHEFEVTGLLVSLDGSTVVVMGPDGEVSAAVTAGTEVKGDPAPGDAVKAEGSVLGDGSFQAREVEPACDDADDDDEDEIKAAGDLFTCPSGEQERFKFEQDGDEFEVKGLLVSLTATEVQVTGPDGVPGGNPVIAAVNGTEIEGSPEAGDFVEVEGRVLADGSFQAREIKDECEDADEPCDADEVAVEEIEDDGEVEIECEDVDHHADADHEELNEDHDEDDHGDGHHDEDDDDHGHDGEDGEDDE